MNLGKPIFSLVVLFILLVGLYAVAALFGAPIRLDRSAASRTLDMNIQGRSVLTPEEMTATQEPRDFQMLVSYTDNGFAPRDTTMRVGDTVRFINNSRVQVWIASHPASYGQLYPGIQNGCGSSAFDSCTALDPGEYREFTFDAEGMWGFSNRLNNSQAGVVNVVSQK